MKFGFRFGWATASPPPKAAAKKERRLTEVFAAGIVPDRGHRTSKWRKKEIAILQ